MAMLMRYDPFREALRLRDVMDQLFENSFVRQFWGNTGTATTIANIPMDVYETDYSYHVNVLLPGVKPEDVELTVQQNTLTIKGQFNPSLKPDQQVNWLLQEIGSGSFERSITFPKAIDADHIETGYEYGILTITVPLSEVSRPKKISISVSQPKQLVEAGS